MPYNKNYLYFQIWFHCLRNIDLVTILNYYLPRKPLPGKTIQWWSDISKTPLNRKVYSSLIVVLFRCIYHIKLSFQLKTKWAFFFKETKVHCINWRIIKYQNQNKKYNISNSWRSNFFNYLKIENEI